MTATRSKARGWRPMGGYVTLPPTLVGTPDGERWVTSALTYVAALPPKVPKPAKT